MENGGFWAVALLLAGAVAAVLLAALRRNPALAPTAMPDVAVYRDQLAEVDRDTARGTLAPDEAQRLRLEISRRLLDADRASGADHTARAGQRSGLIPVTLILAVLAAAVAGYFSLGAPGYPDQPLQSRLAEADARMRARPSQAAAVGALPAAPALTDIAPDFLALMDKMRGAVAERPDDLRGLELLSRNEAVLGNFTAAEAAQRQLIAVKGEDATASDHAALAEILISAAGGYVSPEAEAALIDVLAHDPANPMGRYFSGLMFAQSGRFDRSFTLWQALLTEGPPDAPWIAPIRARIEDMAWRAGVNYRLPDAAGPGQADIEAAGRMSEQEQQAMIGGMVAQLSDRLARGGGSVEEWGQLIRALVVLDRQDEAQTIYDQARQRFAGRDSELSFLKLAAVESGLAP